MPLYSLGVNHVTADVAQREAFAQLFQHDSPALTTLINECAVEEAVVLSTCNRTEVYTVTQCQHAVREWLRQQQAQDRRLSASAVYERHNLAMVKHLMGVASGIDSMIVGEPQILGQVKQAYHSAQQRGTVGPRFQHLFPAVFETAKLVRAQTAVGQHPITLTYAVVQLAKQLLPALPASTVVLIGAGETIELVANYFNRHQVGRIIIVNRTLARAHALARHIGAVPLGLDQLAHALQQADLVIAATGAQEPLVNQHAVQRALLARGTRPLVMADLAVPRNIEPAVASLPGVSLYNLDDLQRIVAQNQQSRQEAVSQAQAIIEVQALHYQRQLRVQEAGDMIRRYRQKMEQFRDQELQVALQALQGQEDPAAVMADLARRLTNKLLHLPTTKLRAAASDEHAALLSLMRQLYEL